MIRSLFVSSVAAIGLMTAIPALAATPEDTDFVKTCQSIDETKGRVVCADVAALDQILVYNRFGSFNPYGMIFALNRDVAPIAPVAATDGQVDLGRAEPEADCDRQLGTETRPADQALSAGEVRLRDCKRPRPMVLRVNVGDQLLVRVGNYLAPGPAPDFSKDFCGSDSDDRMLRAVRPEIAGPDPRLSAASQHAHDEIDCGPRASSAEAGDGADAGDPPDWPSTRHVNFVVQGLAPLALPGQEKAAGACFGTGAITPGDHAYCLYKVQQEGTYFLGSLAAPAGGEGNGGSLVHGLFGAVVAQRPGSRWYRSQVTQGALDAAWPAEGTAPNRTRAGSPDYEQKDGSGVPILNMARALAPGAGVLGASHVELVHSDLNAIIYCDRDAAGANCAPELPQQAGAGKTVEPAYQAFREFSVFFHDELKTFYTRNFRELGQLGQLAGVKDGFAINYGASGMGSLLLANRKGIGPSKDCMECLYEEFFLTSWANGDPALLENFPDDPSNVHHSYLNDPVVFRNFHAGPKETHVFHLHAHQWFAGNDPNRGAYLDSQTVAPQQGFTYNIYHGGLRGPDGTGAEGWWDSQGAGNRNRTIGDSIFHCHLYPHFAQGMWALWRVHDVLEDGTRLLPDGQPTAGLSVDFTPAAAQQHVRRGSIDRKTGLWLAEQQGTPVPALVPLPGEALPLAPSYATEADLDGAGELRADAATPMPGYPFYIAGQPGHRPPQAPLDIARNLGAPPDHDTVEDLRAGPSPGDAFAGIGDWLDGGLGRHVIGAGSAREFGISLPAAVTDPLAFAALDDPVKVNAMRQVIAKAFALGDLSGHMTRANVELLDPYGSRLERAAMGFHYNGRFYADGPDAPATDAPLNLRAVASTAPLAFDDRGGYPTIEATRPPATPPATQPATQPVSRLFTVNGSAPRPGAPFADPCGVRNGPPTAGATIPLDPLTGGWLPQPMTADRQLAGFRRYEASAVQLDMVVNRAGWHDPQARINVLSRDADSYKHGSPRAQAPFDAISPVISDTEEPFFFRALSGECIEFRHTNELPKELELDDFQVKTPTDTIGQHIHLVKFDVTSSDGSGNGWNYEDGTFAPDEIASRLCAWVAASDGAAGDNHPARQAVERLGQLAHQAAAGHADPAIRAAFATPDFCASAAVRGHDIWRLPRGTFPFLFQTTTQRWFADPMLSKDETGKAVDRTMRTVFTHDHFGPSSIQQHGFYSALLIEPPAGTGGNPTSPQICDAVDDGACVQPLPGNGRGKVAWGSDLWEGARKLVKTAANDPEHPSFREFALSIADFALLYDPRDRQDPAALRRAMADPSGALASRIGSLNGMAKIYCEARYRRSPFNMRDVCGTGFERDGNRGSFWSPDHPPAWLAGGVHRDDQHRHRYLPDLLIDPQHAQPELHALWDHMVEYRQRAAAPGRSDLAGVMMASPVAPPERPESISVDHHDPYLVNYRGAPIPLRIADKSGSARQSDDCAPKAMRRPADHASDAGDDSAVVQALTRGSFGTCSYSHQMTGDRGDLANALHSGIHADANGGPGDPETPLLEAYANERLVFRMIQGAQEVQHSFNLLGHALKRNLDQAFAQAARPLANSGTPSLQDLCHQRAEIAAGRPGMYRKWFETAPSRRAQAGWTDNPADDNSDVAFWTRYEAALAECDNPEGFTTAQEIGISEHFEMQGSLRSDVASPAEFGATLASAPLPAAGDPTVPTQSSDYLWHFGTVDALWNGAWGLLRIFEGPDAPDPATVPAFNGGTGDGGRAIGDRLGAPVEGPETPWAGQNLVLPGGTGLSCPMPTGYRTPRLVDAALVAFETRAVFDPRGTIYGEGVHDPDGLMLALLSPEQIGAPDITADGDWNGLTRAGVIAALRGAYDNRQPEPMLLRVSAGDCLRLRIVNLLGDADGTMRDLPGDAMLPRIVPLNADPIPMPVELVETGQGSVRKRLPLQPLPDSSSPNGLRASAGLALNLGLPGLDLIRDVPSGFGYNRRAMPGGFGGVTVSPVVAAYAGRYRLDIPDQTGSEAGDIADAATLVAGTLAANDPARYFGRFTQPDGSPVQVRLDVLVARPSTAPRGITRILGDEYVLRLRPEGHQVDITLADDPDTLAPLLEALCGDADCPEGRGLHEALTALATRAVAQAVDDYTHWIPYAFGAVPVRPSGDMISQSTHGLVGAIDVVPTTWTAVDGATVCDTAPVDGYLRCRAEGRPPSGDGQPARYRVANPSGAGEPVTIREFVLFVQDGLNHWDEASSLQVVSAATGAPWPETEIGPARLVPDCEVCDDSYDRGEVAVSQRAPALSRGLRKLLATPGIEESDDLNAYVFPPDYTTADIGQPRLQACEDDQIVIRVVHPGGRARQHAFAVNGYSYDDLFAGFGFPRSALLAPGKAISAWLHPLAYPGTTVWHDGPTHLLAGGIWGLLETSRKDSAQCKPADSQ